MKKVVSLSDLIQNKANIKFIDNGANILLTLQSPKKITEVKINSEIWLNLCVESLHVHGYCIRPMDLPSISIH